RRGLPGVSHGDFGSPTCRVRLRHCYTATCPYASHRGQRPGGWSWHRVQKRLGAERRDALPVHLNIREHTRRGLANRPI
ncbi:hypothetical protein ACMWQU_27240, partial [Escherichia coli]|uniref:hypothetical protein n=1 Tax=Escherichia coli TaxID=562 RepID=UPI0039E0C786